MAGSSAYYKREREEGVRRLQVIGAPAAKRGMMMAQDGLGGTFARSVEDAVRCLRYDQPLDDVLKCLAGAVTVPLAAMALARFGTERPISEAARWSGSEPAPDACSRFASAHGDRLIQALRDGAEPDPCDVAFLLGADAPEQSLPPDGVGADGKSGQALPLFFNSVLLGALLFRLGPGALPQRDVVVLRVLAASLAVFLAGREHGAQESYHNQVLKTAMEQIKTGIYITDPRTDKILYMSPSMREMFGLNRPEGQVCWQVLQGGKNGRCEFCPVPYLEEHAADRPVYRWEEHNSRTGRVFENHDCLIPWFDGSVVHLQQSIDVTDSLRLAEEAHRDELTGLLNRRAGQAALELALEENRRNGSPLAVGLLDVNMVKAINDTHGHAEGDRVLALVAQQLRSVLTAPDFCFRLSGDEFVAVFLRAGRYAAAERMEAVQRRLEGKSREWNLPSQPEFCFGVFEVMPDAALTAAEAVAKADESMYEQKKLFHIREAQRRLTEAPPSAPAEDHTFDHAPRLLYEALAKSTDSYIYVSDVKTGVFRYSPSMVEAFDLPGEVIENAAAVWGARVHPDDKTTFLEANQIVADGRADAHCVEYRVRNRAGEWVWVRCRGHLERDANGDPALVAGFITNLGQKNKIDPVTGLFNKLSLAEDVDSAIRNRPGYPLYLVLFGLDGFKHVNDLYGKSFGDEVLRITGQRMQVMLPEHAVVYRLDGDEFGVVVYADLEAACAVYRSLAESFRCQQAYDGRKYFCTLSAGVAGYPKDAADSVELVQCAGCALETSKANGKNRLTLFSREQIVAQKRSLELIELLRESIEGGYEGFELFYQPQVTADGGRVVGAEALARWTCPKFGQVSPGEFIPLLEQSGLIVPFGRWVFRQAAEQCARWAALRADFTVSVNLSYLQVTADDMVPYIQSTLEILKLNPANLVVEFTESCMIQGDIQRVFDNLRRLGVRIAMDDFGTGYSSLGMLKTSPADVVKIDRTFVRDILHSKFDETFIRFIVELCHHVGIKVCLEGVERDEEMRMVGSMHLDYIQGFLFGRPMSVDDFSRAFLENGASR